MFTKDDLRPLMNLVTTLTPLDLEKTPERLMAWQLVLVGEPITLAEAQAALVEVVKTGKVWVAPQEVLVAAKTARRERLEVEAPGGNTPHPAYLDGRPVDPDDTAGWLEAKAAHRYVQPTTQTALPSRPVQDLLARVRRALPAAGGDQ